MESTLTTDELSSRLTLAEDEVDACVWLPDNVTKALHDGIKCDELPPME